MLDAHLAQGVRGDDQRRDDTHEAGAGEGVAEHALQLDQLRRPPAGTQVLEALPAVFDEHALEALEGGVAQLDVGEQFVEDERVGAELAEALRLRRRQADAQGVGFVGRHDASSSSARGRRAR